MIRTIERLLTFKPNSDDHGALESREHIRCRFGKEFALDLDGVWLPQPSDTTVLFIHGNRHNITRFGDHYDLFRDLGVSCFAFDYPGYGLSRGSPSESVLYASARAAYSFLVHHHQIAPTSLVLYGCSLGGAVALDLAIHHKAACLVTESTFTNSHAMAKQLYPYIPIQRFMTNRFQNDTKVGDVHYPHLLLHGERDPLVPVRMAIELHQRASEPKQLLIVPEATHTNTISVGGAPLREAIGAFIKTAVAGR